MTKRAEEYSVESGLALVEASDEIDKEIAYKKRIFQATYSEEVRPYTETIKEKLAELRRLRQNNDYYLGDIYDSTEKNVLRIM